mmetsp:Transcript_11621/g.43047  ORF Transcript_11621/g.43047 Transcript_11621/m.43047 type:complete len:213 (-) Transcript_11621:223-861(-)
MAAFFIVSASFSASFFSLVTAFSASVVSLSSCAFDFAPLFVVVPVASPGVINCVVLSAAVCVKSCENTQRAPLSHTLFLKCSHAKVLGSTPSGTLGCLIPSRINALSSTCAFISSSLRFAFSRAFASAFCCSPGSDFSVRSASLSASPAALPVALFFNPNILSFCSCALRSPRSVAFSLFSLSFARCSFSLSFFFWSTRETFSLGAMATVRR